MFAWITAPVAAFLGFFCAVLVAAGTMSAVYFVNLRIIERRSERRRISELRAAAAAIRAELSAIQNSLMTAADKMSGEREAAPMRAGLGHLVQLFPQMGAVVAQFPEGAVAPVIKAYSLVADYETFLYLHGVAAPDGAKGERFMLTPEKARVVAKVNDSIARRIQQAIDALNDIENPALAAAMQIEASTAMQVRRVAAKAPVRKAAARAPAKPAPTPQIAAAPAARRVARKAAGKA